MQSTAELWNGSCLSAHMTRSGSGYSRSPQSYAQYTGETCRGSGVR